MKSVSKYLFNILIWIDQGINVILAPLLNIIFKPGKFGNPDETLSSVFGKNQDRCKLCSIICRLLHMIDKNHCEKSVEYDES